MNKAILILLLTIFSHSAISATSSKSCQGIFNKFNRVFVMFNHWTLTYHLNFPDASAFNGMKGYIWIADDFGSKKSKFGSDMRKTYFTVQQILGEKRFKQLGWRLFNGTTLEYKAVWNTLINPNTGKVNSDYIGKDKLEKFAKSHFEGDILRAYMRISEALSPTEFDTLKYSFNGMEGYVWVTDYFDRNKPKYFGNDMRATYNIVQKVLGKEQFKQLGWKFFDGTTLEYKVVRKTLVNPETGEVNPDYIGQDKLERFAEQFNNNVPRAYLKAEEALSAVEFAVLDWEITKIMLPNDWDEGY